MISRQTLNMFMLQYMYLKYLNNGLNFKKKIWEIHTWC